MLVQLSVGRVMVFCLAPDAGVSVMPSPTLDSSAIHAQHASPGGQFSLSCAVSFSRSHRITPWLLVQGLELPNIVAGCPGLSSAAASRGYLETLECRQPDTQMGLSVFVLGLAGPLLAFSQLESQIYSRCQVPHKNHSPSVHSFPEPGLSPDSLGTDSPELGTLAFGSLEYSSLELDLPGPGSWEFDSSEYSSLEFDLSKPGPLEFDSSEYNSSSAGSWDAGSSGAGS